MSTKSKLRPMSPNSVFALRMQHMIRDLRWLATTMEQKALPQVAGPDEQQGFDDDAYTASEKLVELERWLRRIGMLPSADDLPKTKRGA